jgi:hypothetical protein
MEKSSLTALAREQLKIAREASSGRSAHTVYGGHEHVLRQTLIALAAGHKLDEHDNPARPPCTCCTGGCCCAQATSNGKAPPGTSSSCPPPGTPSKRSKTPPYYSPWPNTDTARTGGTGSVASNPDQRPASATGPD